VRSAAERMAINMPVKGTAADIIKLAMIAVHKKYGSDPDINLVLQVHDELVFEAKKEKIEEYAKEIKTIMENIYMMKVPLKVSAYEGENWGEMRQVEG
jgi:DNA polymerase-1